MFNRCNLNRTLVRILVCLNINTDCFSLISFLKEHQTSMLELYLFLEIKVEEKQGVRVAVQFSSSGDV